MLLTIRDWRRAIRRQKILENGTELRCYQAALEAVSGRGIVGIVKDVIETAEP
jgi:hypothetical protein